MADHKILRQNKPGPICHRINRFTGVVLAKGTGNTTAAAKKAAKNLASSKRDEALEQDKRRRCPGRCMTEEVPRDDHDVTPVGSHKDGNKYIAYNVGEWEVVRYCKRERTDRPPLPTPRPASISVSHKSSDPACGKTRVFSGCEVAFGKGRTLADATNVAKQAAKDKANAASAAVVRTKRCPRNCRDREKITPAVETPKLIRRKKVDQAHGEPCVAYVYVFWKVTIEC